MVVDSGHEKLAALERVISPAVQERIRSDTFTTSRVSDAQGRLRASCPTLRSAARRRSPPQNILKPDANHVSSGKTKPDWNSFHHLTPDNGSTSANSKRPARHGEEVVHFRII